MNFRCNYSRLPKITTATTNLVLPDLAVTNALFQAAFSAHIAGQLVAAQNGYLQVLSNNEYHANALHMLGILHREKGNLVDAEALIRKALSVEENAFYLFNLAVLLKTSHRLPEAEAAYRRALVIKPDYVDAHGNLGNLLHESGRLPEAEAAFRRALDLNPHQFGVQYNLANMLMQAQRLPEAEAEYRHVLTIKPTFAEAHNNLAILLIASERLPEAEAAFRRALALKPDYADAHNNLGDLFKKSQRLPEAEAQYRCALAVKPECAEAHNKLAVVLMETQRLPEAEVAYRRALVIKLDYVDAYYNLAKLLQESKRFIEAEALYLRAVDLRPDFAEAHHNLASIFWDTHRQPEAEALYLRALAIQPDSIQTAYNLSLLLLTLQRYSEAWPLYEVRYSARKKETSTKVPELPYPQWKGESLRGKSLMIWPEQGLGDYIQFVRYVPVLKALGVSHLTLACVPSLSAFLATVDGVDAVVTELTQVPAHDYWSFIMSLPLNCATTAETIPVSPMPYLHALPSRVALWRDRLPALPTRKVGLVWKGSTRHKNDVNRSLPDLARLAPLWAVPGVTFVSLQKGQGEEEALHPPPGQPLVELGTHMHDFADSAAIVSQLDLVICVDTAIAHVAGALGKPCWLLLPAIGTDWRWQLDRTDSPWYPSIRLFRQWDISDWSQTVGNVGSALNAWASSPC